FEELAREAKAWGDVDAALAAAVEGDVAPGPLADALAPYAEAEVVARPFYLDATLRWLTFEPDGAAGRLRVLEMQADGSLGPGGPVDAAAWPTDAESARARRVELRRLLPRDVFAGQVYDLVDASEYAVPVAQAAAQRIAAIDADLRTAQAILRGLGAP